MNAPALEAVGACEQRDTFSKLLTLMDYCYGPSEKAGPATWSPCDAAKKAQGFFLGSDHGNFHRMRGVFVLSAGLNGNTRSYFVVNSGAANVQIPQEVADELTRNGTLNQSDFLGERRFVVADGRGVLQRVIRLRSVQVGNRTMENVLAAVGAPQQSGAARPESLAAPELVENRQRQKRHRTRFYRFILGDCLIRRRRLTKGR